jgi:hypothetical protein
MVALTVTALEASATTVVAMNLDDLTIRSDAIVLAKAKSVTYAQNGATGYPETRTTFEIEEVYYGDKAMTTTTVSLIGGPTGSGAVTIVPGMPRFKVDERAVLFLVKDTKTGFTLPTGLEQGVFRIKVDPETEKAYIVNQSVDLGISSVDEEESESSKTGKDASSVTLKDFGDLVKKKVAEKKEKN